MAAVNVFAFRQNDQNGRWSSIAVDGESLCRLLVRIGKLVNLVNLGRRGRLEFKFSTPHIVDIAEGCDAKQEYRVKPISRKYNSKNRNRRHCCRRTNNQNIIFHTSHHDYLQTFIFNPFHWTVFTSL